MPQENAHSRRRWRLIAGIILLMALVAGCGAANDGASRSAAQDDGALTVTERLSRYHESLRAEVDWLWANMFYAQSHTRPDSSRCQSQDFDHQVVTLSEDERQQDSAVATLEQLDYTDLLVAQARSEWQLHCRGERTSANTAVYMRSRLEPAYRALERARAGIEARRQSEARGR